MKFDFDIQIFSGKKMFENNGHIHAFSHRAGVDNLLKSFVFLKILQYSVNVVICCKVYPLNDCLTVFPNKMQKQPNLTMP